MMYGGILSLEAAKVQPGGPESVEGTEDEASEDEDTEGMEV